MTKGTGSSLVLELMRAEQQEPSGRQPRLAIRAVRAAMPEFEAKSRRCSKQALAVAESIAWQVDGATKATRERVARMMESGDLRHVAQLGKAMVSDGPGTFADESDAMEHFRLMEQVERGEVDARVAQREAGNAMQVPVGEMLLKARKPMVLTSGGLMLCARGGEVAGT